jgi:hypothetical protein
MGDSAVNRFFLADPSAYEAIRAEMDAESGFPSAQAATWFAPAAQAPRDFAGRCLLAAIAPIAERFSAEGVEEMTAEEFAAALPPPQTAL